MQNYSGNGTTGFVVIFFAGVGGREGDKVSITRGEGGGGKQKEKGAVSSCCYFSL